MRRLGRVAAGAATMATTLVFALPPSAAATYVPPLPDTSKAYWFVNWDIPHVWAQGAQGQGVTVAVLDSGVQASRPELTGRVLAGTDLAGGDGRTDLDTPDGHGTRMADLIVGQGGPDGIVGIAPRSRVLPVRVHGKEIGPDFADNLTAGIRYSVDHHAKVVNVSQGGDGTSFADGCPAPMADAVRYAIERGAVVVASSGNEGNSSNAPQYPAACPGVVAVGAVNGDKRIWPSTQRQSYVDVAAPGVEIYGENLAGQTGTGSGTSDATALVSGAIALVWSKFPRLTNRQVVARILATVTDDVDIPGRDTATGYGIVRPHVAIHADVALSAPNPIFDELEAATGSSSPSIRSTPSTSGHTTPASVPQSQKSSGGPSIGAVVGIVAGAAIVLALVVLTMFRSRRAHSGPFV